MVYTGEHVEQQTKINRFVYHKSRFDKYEDLKLEDDQQYIQVVGLSDIKIMEEIKEMFSIDAFIMEDILNVHQRNKIEYGDDYIFASFSFFHKDEKEIRKRYMSIYVSEKVVFTFHEKEPNFLAPLEILIKEYQELKANRSDFMFYQILDLITDEHLDILDNLDNQMNAFEEQIIEAKQIDEEDFYLLRKRVIQLKNMTSPIYEQLVELLKKQHVIMSKQVKSFYHDLIDHMSRLDQKLNLLKDMMRTLLDLNMNNQSTRMNKIMSTLTIFSAIFIPLSFLTGFFGMNFVHFGVLEYQHAVIIFISVCVLVAGAMVYIFKKHKWF
jgi:magnesium transporter